jgi:hypothetical protein
MIWIGVVCRDETSILLAFGLMALGIDVVYLRNSNAPRQRKKNTVKPNATFTGGWH